MSLTLTAICIAVLCLVIVVWIKRARERRELELHSITPEALHTLLVSNQEVLLFDVRQPLDLLADSEIIPGAIRIPPNEVLQNPSLIPREKDTVVYCTCLGDKTSRSVLRRTQAMHYLHVKFLKGGLAGWKAKGYPVERYEEPFHLDTST
jgi:rhodanese-related sulfurtransferase